MSLGRLEQAVFDELRLVAGDRKLRWKDVMEWSSGPIEAQEGEKLYHLPKLGINCAVKVKDQRRGSPDVEGQTNH